MVASKGGGGGSSGGGGGAGLTNLIPPTTAECCMCGDYGLSQQLFRCKICKSRFQHKYCSNQYPKAESYKSCNWCLTQKHESGKSTSPSSPCINNSGDDHRDHDVRNKRNADDKTSLIKKVHRLSPEKESPKRAAGGIVEEKNHVVLRKSKSANHLAIGGGIKARPLFKNRVRRYKLLDEVSSQ
ncbi:hypothetical protein R6Q59_036487 [Mikania micrantha]